MHHGYPMPDGVVPWNIQLASRISVLNKALREFFPESIEAPDAVRPWGVDHNGPHTPEEVTAFIDWYRDNKKCVVVGIRKKRAFRVGPERSEYLRLCKAMGVKPSRRPIASRTQAASEIP